MNSLPQPGETLIGLSQRLPPANLEAEQALLGALLANNKAYERVSEFLAPEHFADAVHGRIFAAIQRRIEAGQLADAVTLRAEFEHSGLLDEVGGAAYLARLLSAMVGIINAGEYGKVIHDCWMRRQLIDLGETVVNRAFGAEAELDAREQLEAAEQSLFEQIQANAKAVGFDVVLTPLDLSAWYGALGAHEYEAVSAPYTKVGPDVLRILYHSDGTVPAPSGYFANHAGVTDPELDALLDEASATADADERADLYRQAQQRVLEGYYILPLYDQQNHFLTRGVTGVRTLDTVATPTFLDARLAS